MKDLFGEKSRRPKRVMMHVADAGVDVIRFECSKCGHDTGWVVDEKTVSENKRGIPCPDCNDRHKDQK